ncbi:X-ray repair cross-complementing protein 5-like [Paramacrobiotus metropolitanus]|uniref:X-ray repair cross-complementing protein 5-like n=1 Tax=Paramacrobiotus metropolitanus TaxID=2943436 RepID=UPI002445FD08|nr:X-ray repair cross-complementing protein 5-like [Paramacrobiotus metropolitanus]
MANAAESDDGRSSPPGDFAWGATLPDDDPVMKDAAVGRRDAILFVIDLSRPMHALATRAGQAPETPSQSALRLSLHAVRTAIRHRIFAQDHSLAGILLYNTSQSAGTRFPHIVVHEELREPGVETVLKIDQLLASSAQQLTAEYGCVEKCAVGDVLWACNSLFVHAPVKLARKQICIFTANDNPHGKDKKATAFARQKAFDAMAYKIETIIFPLVRVEPAGQFNMQLFWQGIVQGNGEEGMAVGRSGLGDWRDLEAPIRIKDADTRHVARLTLSFGDGLECAVSVYSLTREAKRPIPVKLSKHTHEEVKTQRLCVDMEKQDVLLPSAVKHFLTYDNRQLYFTAHEMEQLKCFGPPGFWIICFKALKHLDPVFHFRAAHFLYPNEVAMRGSTKLFAALLIKCLEKQVMALCRYIPRPREPPQLVALVPQDTQRDANGKQTTPSGFLIVFQPFADDLRERVALEYNRPTASATAVEKATEHVKRLHISCQPQSTYNPVLIKHRRTVESVALKEKVEKETAEQRLEKDRLMDQTWPRVDEQESGPVR